MFGWGRDAASMPENRRSRASYRLFASPVHGLPKRRRLMQRPRHPRRVIVLGLNFPEAAGPEWRVLPSDGSSPCPERGTGRGFQVHVQSRSRVHIEPSASEHNFIWFYLFVYFHVNVCYLTFVSLYMCRMPVRACVVLTMRLPGSLSGRDVSPPVFASTKRWNPS
jgi:hypothetical protein